MRVHTIEVIVTLIKWLGFRSQWLAPNIHRCLSLKELPHPKGFLTQNLASFWLNDLLLNPSGHVQQITTLHTLSIPPQWPHALSSPGRTGTQLCTSCFCYSVLQLPLLTSFLVDSALHKNVLPPATHFNIPTVSLEISPCMLSLSMPWLWITLPSQYKLAKNNTSWLHAEYRCGLVPSF